MTFETGVYTLTGFLLLLAILFYLVAYTLPTEKKGFIKVKGFFIILSVTYLVLAMISLFVGVSYSVELSNQAPCENLLMNETFDGSTNITVYDYTDSCASRATPEAVGRLAAAYAYVMYASFILLVFGIMFLAMKKVLFEW